MKFYWDKLIDFVVVYNNSIIKKCKVCKCDDYYDCLLIVNNKKLILIEKLINIVY